MRVKEVARALGRSIGASKRSLGVSERLFRGSGRLFGAQRGYSRDLGSHIEAPKITCGLREVN